MKLNLACGDVSGESEIGIDIYPSPAVNVIADIAHLPLGDATVDEIQCYQAVEHFFPDETMALWAEWARVMKPGAKLYISTPDFRYVANQFANNGMQIGIARAYICGTTEWNTYKKDQPESYHRTLWDYQSLSSELMMNGFGNFETHNEEWNLFVTCTRM